MLVIADAEKPVAVAGIMGGLDTEVTDGTTSVLIESAQFDQLCTRRTSRKLGLMSDSNYRFERGVDPVGLDQASLRACQLILELAGGELAPGMVDVWARHYVAPTVELRPQRANKILGIDIPTARQVEILAKLCLSPQLIDGKIRCTIPSFRQDITREIDLIEEVGRLEGFGRIPVGSQITHKVTPAGIKERTHQAVAAIMSAAGYDEAMTFTFIDLAEAELFSQPSQPSQPNQPGPLKVDPIVRKTNNVLRPGLLPNLLRACKVNQDAGAGDLSLYERSSVFPPGLKQDDLPQEHVELALVSTRDLRLLRGAIEAVVHQISPTANLDFSEASVAGLADGTAAEILLNGKTIGSLGMISTKVKDYYGLERQYAAASLEFSPLLALAGAVRTYQPIPKFPAIRRDLSLVVDENVTWRQLTQAIRQLAQPMLAGWEYVTTYRGKQITQGRKSVTITLTYQSPDGTLRKEQVDEQIEQLVQAMKGQFKAELRA
jgi:phenylalanyl-tRNA synthetase beta chain